MSRKVLPAFGVFIGDWLVTVRVDLEDKVWIESPEYDDGEPKWSPGYPMTPKEAINLAEALTLAAQATQERTK